MNAEREKLRVELERQRKLMFDALLEIIKLKKLQKIFRKNANVMIVRENQTLKELKKNAFITFAVISAFFESADFELFALFEFVFFSLNLNFFDYTELLFSKRSSNVQ